MAGKNINCCYPIPGNILQTYSGLITEHITEGSLIPFNPFGTTCVITSSQKSFQYLIFSAGVIIISIVYSLIFFVSWGMWLFTAFLYRYIQNKRQQLLQVVFCCLPCFILHQAFKKMVSYLSRWDFYYMQYTGVYSKRTLLLKEDW